MARVVRSAQAAKPAIRGCKPVHPLSPPAKAKSPKVTAASGPGSAMRAPAPKPSEDELRARVEQLERANTTLRGKSREATRAAKIAATRIAELEEQVARLEKQIAAQPAASTKGRRLTPQREIGPGDAVPSGVAVAEPMLTDLETEVASYRMHSTRGRTSGSPRPS
jgi:hypothetical protein